MNMCDISMVVFAMYLPHVYVESLVGSECARSSLCSFRVVLGFIVGLFGAIWGSVGAEFGLAECLIGVVAWFIYIG